MIFVVFLIACAIFKVENKLPYIENDFKICATFGLPVLALPD